jgi:hypothetical protein
MREMGFVSLLVSVKGSLNRMISMLSFSGALQTDDNGNPRVFVRGAETATAGRSAQRGSVLDRLLFGVHGIVCSAQVSKQAVTTNGAICGQATRGSMPRASSGSGN